MRLFLRVGMYSQLSTPISSLRLQIMEPGFEIGRDRASNIESARLRGDSEELLASSSNFNRSVAYS